MDYNLWHYYHLLDELRLFTAFEQRCLGTEIYASPGLANFNKPLATNPTAHASKMTEPFSAAIPVSTVVQPISPEQPVKQLPRSEKPQTTTPISKNPCRVTATHEVKMPLEERQQRMQEFATQASICKACNLHATRTQVVFGSGPVDAELVVVGEAPGYHEDIEGLPFVGEAGQLLTRMLEAIQIKREQVYICNTVKCRPPENRQPQPEETKACQIWLMRQFLLLSPLVILALGKFASVALTGREQSMSKYRAQQSPLSTYKYQGIPVVFSYHPSYLLRTPTAKKEAWKDLQLVQILLKKE